MSIRSEVDKLEQAMGSGHLGFDLAAELSRGANAPAKAWGPQDPTSLLQRRLKAATERLARMRAEDEQRAAA